MIPCSEWLQSSAQNFFAVIRDAHPIDGDLLRQVCGKSVIFVFSAIVRAVEFCLALIPGYCFLCVV